MAARITNNASQYDSNRFNAERSSDQSKPRTAGQQVDQPKPDIRNLDRNINMNDGSVLADPRQAAEGMANRNLPGTEIPTYGDVDNMPQDGRHPVGTDGGIKTSPNDRSPDPLGGAFSMEGKFESARGSRIQNLPGVRPPNPRQAPGHSLSFPRDDGEKIALKRAIHLETAREAVELLLRSGNKSVRSDIWAATSVR